MMPFSLLELVTLSRCLRDACLGIIKLAYPETKTEHREEYMAAFRSVGVKTNMEVQQRIQAEQKRWVQLFKVGPDTWQTDALLLPHWGTTGACSMLYDPAGSEGRKAWSARCIAERNTQLNRVSSDQASDDHANSLKEDWIACLSRGNEALNSVSLPPRSFIWCSQRKRCQ